MERMGVHLFFRWLPGWFIAAGSYVVLAGIFGARARLGAEFDAPEVTVRPVSAVRDVDVPPARDLMYWLMGLVALAALAWCLVLPLQVFRGASFGAIGYRAQYMIATLVYFIAATIWFIRREKSGRDD
jgi:hypothetical protein